MPKTFDIEQKLEAAWNEPSSTVARLLAEAERAFAESGFEGARTRDIAAAVGVNIASLHFHWKNKRTLYGAVLLNFQRRASAFHDHFLKEVASDLSTNTDDRFDKWFGLGFAMSQSKPWMSRIELRRFAASRPIAGHDDLEFWLARFRSGEEMLRANTSESGSADIDMGLTSMSLMYLFRMFLCDSDVQQEFLGGSLYSDEKVQERVFVFLRETLRQLIGLSPIT